MQGKHTPGPWEAPEKTERHADATAYEWPTIYGPRLPGKPARWTVIGTVNPHPQTAREPGCGGDAAANARLIAAAPDLLGAARRAEELLAKLADTPAASDRAMMLVAAGDLLRAAIAKAEGK